MGTTNRYQIPAACQSYRTGIADLGRHADQIVRNPTIYLLPVLKQSLCQEAIQLIPASALRTS